MAKQLIKDDVWRERFSAADRYYRQWEEIFSCKILEKYYEGKQWKDPRQSGYKPYVLNRVYENIQIKISNFMPSAPKFQITPRPANSEWNLETAAASAQLKQDVLNTLVGEPKNHFNDEIESAYKDHFFRFGMLEVGYAAEWILNPSAPKPLLKKDSEKNVGGKARSKITNEPNELPAEERVFIKRIPASTFRIGGTDARYLERCGWVGYFEWVDRDELLSLKIKNRDKFEATLDHSPNERVLVSDQKEFHIDKNSVKVWFVWDLKGKRKLLVLDSPSITLFDKSFDRLPFCDLRTDLRVIDNGFYPIPPVFHWISSQDEINEAREMMRAHRRRFKRKFQVMIGGIDDPELEKFETGEDGALIKTLRDKAISPIEDANLGQSAAEALTVAPDDMNRISGITAEDQGVADRTTATQANIVNQRSSTRASKERDRILQWLESIGREILLTARDRFTLGIWAKYTAPEGEDFLGQMQEQLPTYRWVTTEDLSDGYDFKIEVDVTTISTTVQAEEEKKFIKFLSILTQFPMIAFSPLLVREAAFRVGYRNEKAIKELQKMALLMELGRMNQLQAAVNPGPAGQNVVQQAAPAGQAIQQQVSNPNATILQ